MVALAVLVNPFHNEDSGLDVVGSPPTLCIRSSPDWK